MRRGGPEVAGPGRYGRAAGPARVGRHNAGSPFLCTYCGAGFSMNWLRSRHEKSVHERRGGTVCHICRRTFTRVDNMREHIRRVHRLPM